MKIEKKEQLANTYIVNDCPIKRDAYISLCDKLGFDLRHVKKWPNAKTYGVADHFADDEVWCELTDGTISKCKQLRLSDLIDLENSKVYTTDSEVVRKYTRLCDKCLFQNHNAIGVFNHKNAVTVVTFSSHSRHDKGERLSTITTDQINALYTEKFGNSETETPEEKEALDLIGQHAKNRLIFGAVAYPGRIESKSTYDRTAGGSVKAISPEWDGNGLPPTGAKCEFEYPKGRWNAGYYHGETISEKVKMHILEFEGGELIKLGGLCNFRKQETEAERNERERLEAAYDLYQTLNNGKGCQFELFQSLEQAEWLAIVDKTGYRKS